MSEYIKTGISIIWLLLLLYWLLAGLFSKKVKQEEPLLHRFVYYWLPLIVASLLLGPGEWFGHTWLRTNFVEHNNLVGGTGLLIAFVGAALACRARFLLGKNWSLAVQQKENHEFIRRGPYAVVRHPIYTGLLLLFAGNGLIVGDNRAIVAVVLVFVSFWLKLKKEEKWMEDTFGDDYREYKKRTAALFPFLL